MSLAAKLPYTHPFAGGFPYRGSQRLPSDPDALTYLAAVDAADGAPVETAVAVAVDDFFRGMKAGGTFGALKAACLLCGARTLAGALVPLAGDAPTNYNFLPEDYNRETGLVGNGSTKYLDSNRANDDDPQNDNHNSVFISTVASTLHILGSRNSVSGRNFMDLGGGGNILRVAARSNSVLTSSYAPNNGSVIAHSRSASAEMSYRLNGVTYTDTLASEPPDSDTLLVYARRNVSTGAAENFSANRLAFYSIGEGLDLAALDAHVSALVTAIGAAL
jgi:hypothetical protein